MQILKRPDNRVLYFIYTILYTTGFMFCSGSIIQTFMLSVGMSETEVSTYSALTQFVQVIAIFGKLHPAYLKSLKLNDVYYCEMILDPLAKANPAKVKAPVVSKYPSVSRDISLMLKDDVKAADLLSAIRKTGGKIVKKAEVFDIYQGEHIDEGYKSISLNIVYEDPEKTLKTEDVNDIHEKVLADLISRFDAKQR